MINAQKELLSSFFTNTLQYIVPFFQRSYVWDDENWKTLWEHINEINNKESGTKRKEHFIGTLITKQRESTSLGEKKLDLIDGQQRLTTFAILLKAIADKASGNSPYHKLKEKTTELVVFTDTRGQEFIRIEHSRNDKPYFEAVILGKDLSKLPNKEHKIIRAYDFFTQRLKEYSDEELDELTNTILNHVPVISMLLSPTDDEQEIFDTINSLGVRLTTGELLKNHIFSSNEIRPHFEDLWEKTFEEDEEQVNFWNSPKTSGRMIRTNIEVLLYCFLSIHKGSIVELDKLFSQYKEWLNQKDYSDKLNILKELKVYATIYQDFPKTEELNDFSFDENEKRFFHIIDNLEITTIYPLVLFLYRQESLQVERNKMLNVLESYLVRRNICRLSTKNYNRLFIQIISELEEVKTVSEKSLLVILNKFKEDTNKFPSDEEVRDAFANQQISNSNAREILYCIALSLVNNPKSDVKKLCSGSYSVEHIMPQKWETNWNNPPLNSEDRIKRAKKIKTLGNLTLVTKTLNSSMKNAEWQIKKTALSNNSMLKITTDYLKLVVWDEAAIEKRAKDLVAISLKIWSKV